MRVPVTNKRIVVANKTVLARNPSHVVTGETFRSDGWEPPFRGALIAGYDASILGAFGASVDAAIDPMPEVSGAARNAAKLTLAPVLKRPSSGLPYAYTTATGRWRATLTAPLPQPLTAYFFVRSDATTGTFLFDGSAGARCALYTNAGKWRAYAGTNQDGGAVTGGFQVVGVVFNGAQSYIDVDGVVTGPVNVGAQALGAITLLADSSGLSVFNGCFCEAAIWSGAFDAGQRELVRDYLRQKWAGNTASLAIAPNAKDYADTQDGATAASWWGAPTSRSETTIQTNATWAQLVSSSTMVNLDTIAYKVDAGAWTNVSGAAGTKLTNLALGAGAHTIVLRDGSGDYGPPVASQPKIAQWTTIRADAPLTQIHATKRTTDRCLMIVGDSMSAGRLATNGATESYAMLTRAAFPGDVLLHAFGGDRLTQYYNSAAFVAEMVRRFDGYEHPELFLLIGYNDSAANIPSLNFGVNCGVFLDALHAAIPALKVWLCGPLTAATDREPLLAEYRTAEQGLVASRAAWLTYIDGTAACSHLDADNIHPSTAGHADIVAYIRDASRLNF